MDKPWLMGIDLGGGGARYPLGLPEGTGGLTPSLTLSYSANTKVSTIAESVAMMVRNGM